MKVGLWSGYASNTADFQIMRCIAKDEYRTWKIPYFEQHSKKNRRKSKKTTYS